MATIYDLAGTTSHSFTLGDGTTIFYGIANPNDEMGKIGDIYVQMNKDTSDIDEADEISEIPQNPDVGYIFKWTGPTDATYIENYYYKWNGTAWVAVCDSNEKLGRIWYKEAYNDTLNNKTSRWSFIKTYSFDDDIIHAIETGIFSNDFRIELESADNVIPNGSIDTSTSASTDYDVNRAAYGVTRFAVGSETYAQGSGVNKFIVETPAQIKADIEVEKTRAQGVEQGLQNQIGDLSQLTTPVTTNLVAAANDLQRQIQVIVDKKDVVDLVEHYSDLIAYDTATLGDNDVIKVLSDETNNDATTFYRWVDVPSTPDVSVATKAALDAYSTTGLQEGDVAEVTADETHSGNLAYYEWEKINGTYGWKYAGPSHNDEHPSELHYWSYIGEEGPFYTKIEADGRFVHLTGNETIEGSKTFNNNVLNIKSTSIDSTDTSTTGMMHVGIYDANNIEMGHLKTQLSSNDKISTEISATRTVNGQTKSSIISVAVDSAGVTTAQAPTPTDTTSTASTQIATVGWVNTVGNNVVHLNGNEAITGTKDFTGATVTVATQATSDDSNKAASTEFVHDLVDTSLLPAYDSTTAGKYLSVDNNGDTVWASINNVPLGDLSDVFLPAQIPDPLPTSSTVLIYDPSLNNNGGGWTYGSQITATIKYW